MAQLVREEKGVDPLLLLTSPEEGNGLKLWREQATLHTPTHMNSGNVKTRSYHGSVACIEGQNVPSVTVCAIRQVTSRIL